ncbi:MAG: PA14 domain-containing protein, partial [Chitinophagaceae bacterium]
MKQVLLGLILVFCCGAIQSQTIFNPSDVIVNYNSGAASGSSANPNIPWGLNITRWVRTPKMSWNTDRYKCYMIGNVPFRLRYPDTYVPGANDGKKYPVMLFWHGGGEANPNTYDNEFQLFNGGQTFPQKITDGGQDAFILFPQSRNSGWDNSYFTLMNVVIDSLIKNCKGDEDRVLSMGLSIGGTASFDYALAYPKRASTIIANSPVFIDTYNSSFGPAVHIPLWLGSGGQDVNPTPTAVQNFVNAYNNTGGNLYWSFYPTRGHVMWDYQWAEEPNYGDRMRTTHKANPLVYFNNRFFCPGSPVSSRMGITPGFFAYQWDKNGTTIGGAVSNEYIATDFGTYRARFKRTSSSDWSAWSLAPAVISPVCPPVSGTGTGLKGTYYNNINVTPPSVLTRTDAAFNFIWDENVSPGSPVAGQNFSIKWTGKIQPQFSETYTIYTRTDDGVRLWINGVQLINNYTDHSSTEDFGSITLAGGQKYDIRIEYYNKGGGGLAYLKWSSPSTVKQMIPTKQLYPDGTGDPDVPLCATNTLPANGAVTATSTTAVLSWSNVLNATSYDVYLWTGATPPASPTAANVATNTYNASGLTASALYNWYVVPKNAGGSATSCITNNKTTFTTAGVPVCAVNTLPANASTIATATTAALGWGTVANATSYDVYLWTGVTPPASP